MSKQSIDQVFKKAKQERRVALIPFITAGDPNLRETQKTIEVLSKEGADLIELGIPFSDPLADGPIIQKSSERALAAGVTLSKILTLVSQVRKKINTPILLMGYYNPILKMGLSSFAQKAAKAGVDGVIIPDLPPEEAGPWIQAARKASLATPFLVAPTSSKQRIQKISRVSTGFIYYVSLTGTTGVRSQLQVDISKNIRLLRASAKQPICVGFGVSKPEHVQRLTSISDGVIVGSAIVRLSSLSQKQKLIRSLKKSSYKRGQK